MSESGSRVPARKPRRRRASFQLVGIALAVASMVAACSSGTTTSSSSSAPAAASSSAPAAASSSASNFYAGKTITLIVPNAPGGLMDVTARIVAPYLQKYAGAAAIRVQDVKGAGGTKGLNALWAAKNDGMTIGFTSVPTVVLTSLLNGSAVHYNAEKLVYIGRISTAPRVLVASKKSGITSAAQLKGKTFTLGIQGFDDDFYTQAALAASLGFTAKFVSGFDSLAAQTKSLGTGETQLLEASLASQDPTIKSGLATPIVMISDKPAANYPNVPTWQSLAPNSGLATAFGTLITLERSFFAPPGIPDAATTTLRAALKQALADPKLQAQMNKAGVPPEFMSGSDEQTAVNSIYNTLSTQDAPLKAALKKVQGG